MLIFLSFNLNNNTILENAGAIDINGRNTVMNNTIINNSPGEFSIYGINKVVNNVIVNNNCGNKGLYIGGTTSIVVNNLIANNQANYGGGLYISGGINTICNNTFYGNTAFSYGGGIYTNSGTNSISNNIFWGNKSGTSTTVAGADYHNSSSLNTFRFCSMQLASTAYTYGGNGVNHLGWNNAGNIMGYNPSFFDENNIIGIDNIYGTSDDGLRLKNISPPIDRGDYSEIPSGITTDITGASRVQNTTADMGAYEGGIVVCPSSNIVYVNSGNNIIKNGETWASAFDHLDDALSSAWQCPNITTILVGATGSTPRKKPYNMDVNKKGTEIITSDERDKTFHVRPGLDIRGGYIAGVQVGFSLLSGLLGTSLNTYHTVLIDSSINWATSGSVTKMSGFIIRDAKAIGTGSVTVNGNVVNQNSGGGIHILSGTSVLDNNTITNNSSSSKGAGILLSNGRNTISNNTIVLNTSSDVGGGIYTNNANNSIYNNVIATNTATNKGAGIYVLSGSNNIVNNTIHRNTATNTGGGMYLSTGINAISNTIFSENKSGTLTNISGADFYTNSAINTFKNSLLQLPNTNYTNTGSGNYDLGANATANVFDINPNFLDPNSVAGIDNLQRTVDDGLQFSTFSPLVNTGDNALLPSGVSTDINGFARIQNTTVDIGAYEGGILICPSSTDLYVDANILNGNDGTTWAKAYKNLEDALHVAWKCPNIQKIYVASGTYKPTRKLYQMSSNRKGLEVITTDPRDVTFHVRPGLEIQGGYPTGGGIQNIPLNPTILSGDIGVAGNTDNAYHVVFADSVYHWGTTNIATKINGFTISDGNANGTSNILLYGNAYIYQNSGAAILTRNCNRIISNCTITNNNASFGAGIFTSDFNCTLSNNLFLNNVAVTSGGAIYTECKTNSIKNNTFTNNNATYAGGIYTYPSVASTNSTISDNIFNNNSVTGFGGALFIEKSTNYYSTNVIKNNTFTGNNATVSGGAYYANYSDNTISNNIFIGNTANYGAGLYQNQGINDIENNTFTNNTAVTAGGGYFTKSSLGNES